MKRKNNFQSYSLFFSIGLLIIAIFQLFVLPINESLFLIYALICTLIFSLSLAFNKNAAFYHPFIFILLTIFIGITLRSFYMVYDRSNPDINSFFLRDENITYFLQPTFMLLTGLIFFIIGYTIAKGKYSLKKFKLYYEPAEWGQKRLMQLTLIYFLIALAGIVLFVRGMGISSIFANFAKKRFLDVTPQQSNLAASLSYYRLMAAFIQPLLYIFLLNFLTRKQSILSWKGFVLIMITIANLFFPIFTSSRSDLLTIFLNAFIVISLTGKLNARILVTVSLAAVLLFAIVTLLRPSKNNSIDTANIALLDPFVFNRNLLDVSKTSHIINSVPEKIPFQYGGTYLALIYAPIPRTLWPEKPAVSLGKDISHKVYGYSQKNQSGVPPGMPAELYVNFGYTGILVGFFLVGILLKKLYNSFEFEKGILNKNRIVLYVVIIVSITVTLFGSSINQALLTIVQAYIPLYIALKFISIKKTSSVSVHA
jgi:oligosaccharide repeat unit polymerase